MSGEGGDVERFLSLVAAIEAEDPRLTGLQAGLVSAALLGICSDSRAFARLLDIAHAQVLRDLNLLLDQGEVLALVKRDERTLRTHYRLMDPRRYEGLLRPD